jgi:hypothetical protein
MTYTGTLKMPFLSPFAIRFQSRNGFTECLFSVSDEVLFWCERISFLRHAHNLEMSFDPVAVRPAHTGPVRTFQQLLDVSPSASARALVVASAMSI